MIIIFIILLVAVIAAAYRSEKDVKLDEEDKVLHELTACQKN